MLRKKKKQDPIKDAARFGFSFAEQPLTECSDRLLSCAMKGLFIFAAVYGCLGGLISSFDLPHHPIALIIILFTLSMALAFLHYSRLIFNIFYPITFILFVFSIFTYRFYVYSGFQAFLNIMQEKYSTYFDLSILREANEYFTDRYMTITIAAAFIGFVLILLLNIAISESMDLASVILVTFPIFQLGIYIGEMPDFPYLVLLLFSYFMVGIMLCSGHHLLPYRDKVFTEFAFSSKKNVRTFRYHASGKMMLQLTIVFFIFSIFLGIICMPFLSVSANSQRPSSIRKKADEYVRILTQNGLAGFFNRYEASGGLSEGRLGGVSSVRPDYQTDLTVTFVPFAYETLYLKAYTGQEYDGSAWLPPSYNIEHTKRYFGVNYDNFETYTAFLEARRLAHYTETTPGKGMYGKIKIKNLDANPNYLYLPYYATGEMTASYNIVRGLTQGTSKIGTSNTITYYPLRFNYWDIKAQPDELKNALATDSPEAEYITHYDVINISSYIDMPLQTRTALEEIKKEIGTCANMDEQIAAIQEYLEENYTYSMMPGTTPRNADFAVHFLTKQDSGYCAHFATAATLLLRSYGIPARYVEGYAVSVADVAEGSAIDEPYDEWFHGTNPIGETGVVQVDVTDANAHAWVEVYMQGIGWVPREFTPPDTSGDEAADNNYADFWSLFSGIFGQTPPPDTVSDIAATQTATSRFEKLFGQSSFLAKPILMFASAVASLILLLFLFRLLTASTQRSAAYRRGNYAPLLAYRYRNICKVLQRQNPAIKEFVLPSDLPKVPPSRKADKWPYSSEECSAQMDLLEKCCYSQHNISRKEADGLLKFLKTYEKYL